MDTHQCLFSISVTICPLGTESALKPSVLKKRNLTRQCLVGFGFCNELSNFDNSTPFQIYDDASYKLRNEINIYFLGIDFDMANHKLEIGHNNVSTMSGINFVINIQEAPTIHGICYMLNIGKSISMLQLFR